MNLNTCIERKEPRLGNSWNFRGVFHLEKNEPRALTVVVRKIDGLWLQICQNGLDGRAEFSGLGGRVPGFNGNVDLQQKTHGSPPCGFLDSRNVKSTSFSYHTKTGCQGAFARLKFRR